MSSVIIFHAKKAIGDIIDDYNKQSIEEQLALGTKEIPKHVKDSCRRDIKPFVDILVSLGESEWEDECKGVFKLKEKRND